VSPRNSGGNYRSTIKNSMRAYDKLPRRLRDALKYSANCFAPQPVLTEVRRKVPADVLVDLIEDQDRAHSLKIARRSRPTGAS
jgi:hypothetical protein